VANSFKSDMDKDFLSFKRTHFRNASSRCHNLGEDGYECKVIASLDLDKLKALVAKKANSSRTMGRDKVENLVIVFIDDINNEMSKDFDTNLHASINDTGNSLIVKTKGTQVGIKGNKCESLQQKKLKFQRKGRAYKTALEAVEKKLKECEENSDVQYLFKLKSLKYNRLGIDTYSRVVGSLSYRISMINVQTGREDNAVRAKIIKSFASDENSLKFKLFQKAADSASREIMSNILNSISKKHRKKSQKKFDKYENYYTVIVRGVTNDASDRNKLKIIRKSIKQLHAKPKRNYKESTDFEQVYNFGSNEELDMEDFSDNLYDMADSLDFRINVLNKGDNIMIVQFQ
jgi:hypothetical protein